MASKKAARGPIMVDIASMHSDGYGLDESGRVGVTGALPGEKVVATPVVRKRRRLFAKAEKIEHAHPQRVKPICAAADYCGGCSLQHLDGQAQLAWKQDQLKAALGDVQPASWLEPLNGPVSHYRSKARIAVKFVAKKGKVLVGFREKMSPFVADIDRCEVLNRPFADLMSPLATLIGGLSVSKALPQIELAAGENRSALVFRHLEDLSEEDLNALAGFAAEHDVDVYLQPGGIDSVHKLAPEGPERLYYTLPAHDLEFAFHPMDFTQVNQSINRQLVDLAIELLDVQANHTALDLFCGIGNFTLPVARRAGTVIGLEVSMASVMRARENAARNRIGNATFDVVDLFESPTVVAERFSLAVPDRVLLDPPRSGAEAVCKVLARLEVERVVYVSCNPASLARDVRSMTDSGYRLEYAGVIDMFPHTAHVESIACLSAG